MQVCPPVDLCNWQEAQNYMVEGKKIWRKAVMSGKYFRPANLELLADSVGEMEITGMCCATEADRRPLKLGAILAITDIFNLQGLIVSKSTRGQKPQIAATLGQALQSYVKFRQEFERCRCR